MGANNTQEDFKPRILIYDIETSPIISYNWGIWEQNAIEVIEDWQILCFAYKWLDEKKTHIVSQDEFKGFKPGVNDDTKVVQKLRELFDEADVVVAHNGDSFDQKKSQARMLVRGLEPPSPYRQIDTKKVAKKYAKFTSNKLDDLGTYFKLGNKVSTGGFALWKGCMCGDKKSWNRMKRYNIQDVRLLEKVYLKLRPWMQGHPSMNLGDENYKKCPKCGAKAKMHKRGFARKKTSLYQRYQCMSCHGWVQSRTPIKTIEKVEYTN